MAGKRKKSSDEVQSLESLMEETGAVFASDIFQFNQDLPVLSTGIDDLDFALAEIDPETRTGGLRSRTVVEFCGENNSGKSATVEQMTKTTLERFGPHSVVWLASEVPDFRRWENIGLDPTKVIFIGAYSDNIEQKLLLAESGLESLCKFARLKNIRLCVIDSVGALMVEDQLLGERNKERDLFTNDAMAAQAKVINRFIKKFNNFNLHSVLALVNHYREPLNTKPGFTQPSKLRLQTPGGRGMEFAAQVRILCTNTPYYAEAKHSLTEDRIHIGLETKYLIFKNKALPNRIARGRFDLRTFTWENEEAMIDICDFFASVNPKTKETISPFSPAIRKSGNYTYIDKTSFNGVAKAIAYLKEHPEIMQELRKQILPYSTKFFNDEGIDESDINDAKEYVEEPDGEF